MSNFGGYQEKCVNFVRRPGTQHFIPYFESNILGTIYETLKQWPIVKWVRFFVIWALLEATEVIQIIF